MKQQPCFFYGKKWHLLSQYSPHPGKPRKCALNCNPQLKMIKVVPILVNLIGGHIRKWCRHEKSIYIRIVAEQAKLIKKNPGTDMIF